MVRVLASHQCGLDSNPGINTICGLSLLLVLSFAPRSFSPGTPVSPLHKNQHFQIPIRPGIIFYYLFNSATDNKKWSNGETTFSLVERAENSH